MSVQVKFESFNDGDENVKFYNNSYIFNYPCNTSTYCKPYEITLSHGYFLIELWGAQGGNARQLNEDSTNLPNKGGLGAYTRGKLAVHRNMKLYLYLGAKGEDQTTITRGVTSRGGWNFGGDGGNDPHDDPPESGAGGGGGVDIRLIPVDTSTTDESLLNQSILSRIMCAGSGGGALSENADLTDPSYRSYGPGMPAGALSADGKYQYIIGGTQKLGALGKGANGYSYDFYLGCATGGSGSGYRGGYHIITEPPADYVTHSGAGGSSYISGHKGCISPLSESNIHHSGISFTDTLMRSGSEYMPQPDFSYANGHAGHGAARITVLNFVCITQPVCYTPFRYMITITPFVILDDT